MDPSVSATTTPTKLTAEGFRFLVRYSDAVGHKPDAKAVAKASGTSYYVAWRGIDIAKKELAAGGYIPGDQDGVAGAQKAKSGAAGEPKAKGGRKRKAVEEEEEDAELKPEPEKKKSKRGKPAKKSVEVKEEAKEESNIDTDVKVE